MNRERQRAGRSAARTALALFLAAAFFAGVRPAHASGEARTLTLLHTRTNETATVTFRRGDAYDDAGLERLNWLLRDWRVDTPVTMDPRLFDVLWEVYRESGSREPIHVISAYRSPGTNEMLRQRSSAVAEHSQHTAGKAIDVRLPDVDPARLRALAMRLQRGGVGYYASANFVHIDTGSVRAWPRMSLEQLARLFPDGKTVHLPPSGKPLSGYELARAEIAARDQAAGAVQAAAGGPTLLSFLGKVFGAGQSAGPAAPAVFASADPAAVAASAAPAVAPVPDDPPSLLVPLPPRRPPAGPLQTEAAAWPLARLSWLPAPARPVLGWVETADPGLIVQALLTAAEDRLAPRRAMITTLRANARPIGPDLVLGAPDPASRLAVGFAKAGDTLEPVRPGRSAREANAAR